MAKFLWFDDEDDKDDGSDEIIKLAAPDVELEGKDLMTHVRRCILRYMELKKGQRKTQRILRRVEIWLIVGIIYLVIVNAPQALKLWEFLHG